MTLNYTDAAARDNDEDTDHSSEQSANNMNANQVLDAGADEEEEAWVIPMTSDPGCVRLSDVAGDPAATADCDNPEPNIGGDLILDGVRATVWFEGGLYVFFASAEALRKAVSETGWEEHDDMLEVDVINDAVRTNKGGSFKYYSNFAFASNPSVFSEA